MPGQLHVVTKREAVCCPGRGQGTHTAAGGNGVDLPCECGVVEGTGVRD